MKSEATLKLGKWFCSIENLSKNKKLRKTFGTFFPKNVSDKSHSAKIRKESSMIAKRLVSGKNREIGGGFNENKLEKARGTKKNSDL